MPMLPAAFKRFWSDSLKESATGGPFSLKPSGIMYFPFALYLLQTLSNHTGTRYPCSHTSMTCEVEKMLYRLFPAICLHNLEK